MTEHIQHSFSNDSIHTVNELMNSTLQKSDEYLCKIISSNIAATSSGSRYGHRTLYYGNILMLCPLGTKYKFNNNL